MHSITAHCLVKNEENFINYAIKSVINFVDLIIIFDTGSTDKTAAIIQNLAKEYPNKIVFEEKGLCDQARHTRLRQEMVDKTKTDWFMILDGDEVWTTHGLEEAIRMIKDSKDVECLVAPFYLCVGDAYHEYYKKGKINILGKIGFYYPRFLKITSGIHWKGDYNQDTLLNNLEKSFVNENNTKFLSSKYWHLTHLKRSSADRSDYSSGGTRFEKRRRSYFIIGKKIREDLPEVFKEDKTKLVLSRFGSFINFFFILLKK